MKYGFIILLAGIVTLIISLDRLSYLNGLGGLALAFTNYSSFRLQYVSYTLSEGWGIGALIVGAVMLFLAVYPFENTVNLKKLQKYGEAGLVGVTIVGIIFSGFSIYVITPSLHGQMKATVTESGNSFVSTSNLTVSYTASVSGGEGPYNFTWYVTPQNFIGVGYNYSGQFNSHFSVTYHCYEMNPNNFFADPSPENFTVQVTITDSLLNSTSANVTTEVTY